jgi:Sucrose-6F-phosphate phosphohydrolase
MFSKVASEQRQHKLSFHLQRAATSAEDEAVLSRLRSALADAGLAAKVIYSGGVDVDILAQGAGKGRALVFLLQQLREAGAYPTDGVQVNGDSGNDAELFDVPGVRGCVVANAHPELVAYATNARAAGRSSSIHMAVNPCAGGIVEALLAFKQIPDESPAPATTLRNMIIELGMLQSNALAGDLSLLSEPDATWITPGGELRHILSCTSAPADAAAAGLTWVDTVSMRRVAGSDSTGRTVPAAGPLLEEGTTDLEPGALLLVTYQLWSFKGQARDNQRVRLCSALVRAAVPAAKDGFRLVHLHEAFMSSAHTATAAFAALAAASGEEIA